MLLRRSSRSQTARRDLWRTRRPTPAMCVPHLARLHFEMFSFTGELFVGQVFAVGKLNLALFACAYSNECLFEFRAGRISRRRCESDVLQTSRPLPVRLLHRVAVGRQSARRLFLRGVRRPRSAAWRFCSSLSWLSISSSVTSCTMRVISSLSYVSNSIRAKCPKLP